MYNGLWRRVIVIFKTLISLLFLSSCRTHNNANTTTIRVDTIVRLSIDTTTITRYLLNTADLHTTIQYDSCGHIISCHQSYRSKSQAKDTVTQRSIYHEKSHHIDTITAQPTTYSQQKLRGNDISLLPRTIYILTIVFIVMIAIVYIICRRSDPF